MAREIDFGDEGPVGQKLLDGIMRDLQRAAALGLIPEDGAQISKSGEFIINGSNIDEIEDKKMRHYRHKDYPKTLHRLGPDVDVDGKQRHTAEDRVVGTKAEHLAALEDGWSEDPVLGANGQILQAGGAGEVVMPDDDEPPVKAAAPNRRSGRRGK